MSEPIEIEVFVTDIGIDAVETTLFSDSKKSWAAGHKTVSGYAPDGHFVSWTVYDNGILPALGTYVTKRVIRHEHTTHSWELLP